MEEILTFGNTKQKSEIWGLVEKLKKKINQLSKIVDE